MKSSQEIIREVSEIFSGKWTTRDGNVIPDLEKLKLGNDAVQLEGTVLYADMRDSTGLVNNFKNWFAAEMYKAYLVAACHVIRNNGGEITAFDGDRVMAVFIGKSKNTSAAKTALHISHIVREINAKIKISYPNTGFQLQQSIGIDTSPLFIARTGIRSSNDLVWVGRAANYAAKLSALSDAGWHTTITEEVFSRLSPETKYGGDPRRCMWDKVMWQAWGIAVYRSSWFWKF